MARERHETREKGKQRKQLWVERGARRTYKLVIVEMALAFMDLANVVAASSVLIFMLGAAPSGAVASNQSASSAKDEVPAQNITNLQGALDKFLAEHPDLETTNVPADKKGDGYGEFTNCYGTLPPAAVLGEEPIYEGHPLHEWVRMADGEAAYGETSSEAMRAKVAVQAIGPAKAAPFLARWIAESGDSTIPGAAAKCFELFGPKAKSAIPYLAWALNLPENRLVDPGRRECAAAALSYLGPDAIPILLSAVTNLEREDRAQIIHYLGNLGTNGRPLVPFLLQWSAEPDPFVRLYALEAFWRIETNRSAIADSELRTLQDPMARDWAANYLERESKATTCSVGPLFETFYSGDLTLQVSAINGLIESDMDRFILLRALLARIHDPQESVRMAVVAGLRQLTYKEANDALQDAADHDTSSAVREAARGALSR